MMPLFADLMDAASAKRCNASRFSNQLIQVKLAYLREKHIVKKQGTDRFAGQDQLPFWSVWSGL
jgi:hypothetical protein